MRLAWPVMAALLSALYGNPLVAQPDDGRIKIGLVSSGVVRSWHAVEGRRKRGCGFGAAKEAAERNRCPCSRLPPQAGAGKRDSLRTRSPSGPGNVQNSIIPDDPERSPCSLADSISKAESRGVRHRQHLAGATAAPAIKAGPGRTTRYTWSSLPPTGHRCGKLLSCGFRGPLDPG